MTKRNGLELTTGIALLILAVAGTVLFAMSYTTGYYIFGEMQSTAIAILLGAAIVSEIVALTVRALLPDAVWTKFLTFVVTALLAAAAALILGDRVEGIGNCIVTDYDSGHGGEEAIYMSLAGAILTVIAIVYNVIGSFSKDKPADEKTSVGREVGRNVGFGVSVLAVLLAVLIPTYGLVNPTSNVGPNGPGGPGGTGGGGTYTISFNQANGNTDKGVMPEYQFLGGNLGGMVRASSGLFVDITLTLDGSGNYTLFSEAYTVEAGERCQIGDPTGLGMILTMNASGTYTENSDGTYTTAVPASAVLEMQWDTYSAQMRDATGMNVDGESEGSFDSTAHPSVLDFVPETVWTLSGSSIVTYRDANAGGVYKISYNQNNGNTDKGVMPEYQFLGGNLGGMVRASSGLFVDITLTLDGSGKYTLFSEAYTVEAGERCEIGDPTGLGMVLTMNASGSYTENSDGTYTTAVPGSAVFEMQWDTYSAQMRDALSLNVDGESEGSFDSVAYPSVLDFVPETVWTLDSGAIVTYEMVGGSGNDEPVGDALEIVSDDGGTTFTFYADGTYRFYFAGYDKEDLGTYTYEGSILTVTNANGSMMTAEGDPLKLHYVSSLSDLLTGDFTVSAADLAALLSGGGASSGDGLTIISDDGGTTFTFNNDGTYVFAFESYGVEDKGNFTYDGSTLTITNTNGSVVTTEGDPLTFHYVSAVSDLLTGDFTVSAAELATVGNDAGASSNDGVTITSDDGGTTITFNADGNYVFAFESFGVEDKGSYTFDGTTLTITNANGTVVTAEGDPLTFHYVSAVSDLLTGDFTVSAADFQ